MSPCNSLLSLAYKVSQVSVYSPTHSCYKLFERIELLTIITPSFSLSLAPNIWRYNWEDIKVVVVVEVLTLNISQETMITLIPSLFALILVAGGEGICGPGTTVYVL